VLVAASGYATLVKGEQPPKFKNFMPQVHGVLFLLEKDEMKKLQKREGGYELQEIEVSCQLRLKDASAVA